MPITENDLSGVYDGDVLSVSGEKIGSVGQIYLDDQTGEPTFVTANTGLFGMSQSFVPLRGARVDNGNVVVDFDKTTVKDAPRIDDDGSLSPAEEDQLYAYYGMGTNNVDAADYGIEDQTPQPGYARTERDDVTDDARSTDRLGEPGAGAGIGAGIGADRGAGYDATESRPPVVETGTSGPVGHAEADPMTPDAPPADRDRERDLDGDRDVDVDRDRDPDHDGDRDLDRDRDRRDDEGAAVPPATDESDGSPRSGRLRKWVMTEYEPVTTEEVYVEGQGQPSDRSRL
jgi:hypothetical protein